MWHVSSLEDNDSNEHVTPSGLSMDKAWTPDSSDPSSCPDSSIVFCLKVTSVKFQSKMSYEGFRMSLENLLSAKYMQIDIWFTIFH